MLKGKRGWEERAGESGDNYVQFVSTPIILEGNVKIYPQAWAQAFLQINIGSISRVLSQAIFTPEELSKRNSGEKDALPAIKKVAIARAAKWLMSKCQNPWDFKPTAWLNEKEKAEIDNIFQTFDKVGGICGIPIADGSGFCQVSIIKKDISNSSSVQCLDLTKRFRNNSPQEMETGVFVDAVYFSRECWAKAIYEGTSIQEKAEILFTQFLNKEIPLNCLEDLDPVVQLAIIRAVAWISKLKDMKISNCYNFDPSVPEQNKFLAWPEIFGIYHYICIKYGGPKRPKPIMISPSEPIIEPPIKSPVIISTNELGDVTINGHTFTSPIWKEAQFRFKLPEGMEKAGKYLFEQVFTTQEIFTCNVSGRGGRPKFSKLKVDIVFFALEHLGRTPLPEGVRNFQKTKIFVEHPNYLRLKSAKVNSDAQENPT